MRITHALRSIATAAAVGAALAVVMAAPAPASARTQTHRDPRGDVQTESSSPGGDSYRGADVVSLRNTYRRARLRLSMTVADAYEGGQGVIAQWQIATGSDTVYQLSYDFSRGGPFVFFATYDAAGPHELCEGEVSVVVKSDTYVATVPRHCLGGKDKVRVAAHTSARGPMGAVFYDDSRRAGYAGGGFVFGPELYRS